MTLKMVFLTKKNFSFKVLLQGSNFFKSLHRDVKYKNKNTALQNCLCLFSKLEVQINLKQGA